jgi:hypothetical protein
MAKRGRQPGVQQSRIEGFAEDLGRLLGSAQAKAQGWLGQRQNISRQLEQIRDTAAGLLRQLAGDQRSGGPGRRRGGKRAQARSAAAAPRRRRLSAKARKAISEAQKKRWAKLKAGQ